MATEALETKTKKSVINIDYELARKIRMIAVHDGVSMGKVVEDLIGKEVEIEYREIFSTPENVFHGVDLTP